MKISFLVKRWWLQIHQRKKLLRMLEDGIQSLVNKFYISVLGNSKLPKDSKGLELSVAHLWLSMTGREDHKMNDLGTREGIGCLLMVYYIKGKLVKLSITWSVTKYDMLDFLCWSYSTCIRVWNIVLEFLVYIHAFQWMSFLIFWIVSLKVLMFVLLVILPLALFLCLCGV